MSDKIKVAIYFTICVGFMIIAYIGYNKLSELKTNDILENTNTLSKNEERKKLKEFELYLENNQKISIIDLAIGKPTIINIWTSWCKYCDIEMEYFNEMYLEEKDNINFIMINATGDRDSKEEAKRYIEERNFSFEIYYDLYLDSLSSLEIYSYPTTIFVDKDGYINSKVTGSISKEMLKNKIEELI